MSTPDPGPPQTSYSQLRQQASQARDKMDRHKVLLDRYLPIYLGPENEVEYEVDYKFGELADRWDFWNLLHSNHNTVED